MSEDSESLPAPIPIYTGPIGTIDDPVYHTFLVAAEPQPTAFPPPVVEDLVTPLPPLAV